MAVYEALHATKSHPTAEELYRAVKPRISSLSLATVYNTLEALCKAGLARKLPTHNGSCRYDGDTKEHLHISFRDTAEIKDVPMPHSRRLIAALPRSVIEEIENEMGIRIDGMSVQLFAHHVPASA